MPRRILPALLALLLAMTGIAASLPGPAGAAPGKPAKSADYVLVVGIAGLRWDDVDPRRTPTLWRLAERGSIGSLSVRSARQPTCPVDGWLTLGAGNYAAWRTAARDGACPADRVTVEQPDGIGANLPEQRATVLHNREKLRWGAIPGALAESVRCTVAVGPGAAVAAARPYGRVDRYAPELPPDPAGLLASCVLSIIDLGTVAGEDPVLRAAAAARADADLARVLAARPERSLVLVAGVSDTDQTSRLHVAIADGPGWAGGWLTSTSTGREGYLQLIDVAPTVLAALDRPRPERLFIGQPAVTVDGRPADLPAAISQSADADREARAQRSVARWFFGLLAVLQCLLAIAVIPLLRRARRHAGPVGPTPVPRRIVATVELLLVAVALAIPAALVADAVPWWRGAHAGVYFAAVTVVLLLAATLGIRFARGYRRTLGPLGATAALAATVVAADVLTGARLQLNGVTGYSAVEGGRYAGVGPVGLGVLLAGLLLTAGCLAQRIRRNWRPVAVMATGALGVVLVGSGYLGADPVGAIALTAGVGVAAAISTGGWLTLGRVAWATMAGLAVAVGFAVLDLRRPPDERSSLGRFLGAFADGTSGLAVRRSGESNLTALVGSPLTVLAIVGAVLVWAVLLQSWGGLKRLFGIYPAVRAAMAGIATASLIGGLVGGSALNVAGAAAALTVPLAALTALRVLDHATDRTRPPDSDEEAGPAQSWRPAAESPAATRPVSPAGPGTDSSGSPPIPTSGAGPLGSGAANGRDGAGAQVPKVR